MSEDGYDVIVVGGGYAGCVAAYMLANEGNSVVLLERGNLAGAKNMTGGRLYGHSLEKIITGFAKEAPVERRIVKERITMLTSDSGVGVDYTFANEPDTATDSYSVLSASFDAWLAEKAEEAGADIVCGICVEDLIMRNGKVCGVIADGEKLESDVVVLADGANSLLAQKIGIRKEFKPTQMGIGVKELYELSAEVIQDRFGVGLDEGAACLFVGDCSNASMGGGFLYTNKTSISLGLVLGMEDASKGTKSVAQQMEDFKNHPLVAPLIAGGKLVEYSGHVVPEGGYNMIPELVGNGVLLVGDSACLCENLGYMVRGMDFAIASAECAVRAVLDAQTNGDFSATGLANYKRYLEESFIMHDMKQARNLPVFLEDTKRMYQEYPEMMVGIMHDLFTVDGTQRKLLKQKIKGRIKAIGLGATFKDILRGMNSL